MDRVSAECWRPLDRSGEGFNPPPSANVDRRFALVARTPPRLEIRRPGRRSRGGPHRGVGPARRSWLEASYPEGNRTSRQDCPKGNLIDAEVWTKEREDAAVIRCGHVEHSEECRQGGDQHEQTFPAISQIGPFQDWTPTGPSGLGYQSRRSLRLTGRAWDRQLPRSLRFAS